MGVGATNTLDRVSASLGAIGPVTPSFSKSLDVPFAGVLLAIPALVANGLLDRTDKYFQLPNGYYGLTSIFLLVAMMALARVKTVEDLRYTSPGEWGKLLGLDRIPEVRTLREKIKLLSEGTSAKEWSASLSEEWMGFHQEDAGALYIDGHVRVYHGRKYNLPKHFVARQKLCLKGTSDYWINAKDGQPYFVITKDFDPGLLKVLENDIVPRLEQDIKQPEKSDLDPNSKKHRFVMVFDRAGYSPDFFKKMWDKRIACQTYHKYPGDDWDESEFILTTIELPSGNKVPTLLAERGTYLGKTIWVREIRKLCKNGHQTPIISTNYTASMAEIGASMFARWSQENFFKYMRTHYNLDRLVDSHAEEIPETIEVINPAYRSIEGKIKTSAALLNRKIKKFGALNLQTDIDPEKVEQFEFSKITLREEIEQSEVELTKLKVERTQTARHLRSDQLSEKERYHSFNSDVKHLIDTIKMIAYRAETAMTQVMKEAMPNKDDLRALIRSVYELEGDIIPDLTSKTLTVRLHHMANPSLTRLLAYLCENLNQTASYFPGTDLQLSYELVSTGQRRGDQELKMGSEQNPRPQEV